MRDDNAMSNYLIVTDTFSTLKFPFYSPHTALYSFEEKLFNLNNYWSEDELFF